MQKMLGWGPGSWGFHSDYGRIFENGKRSWAGYTYTKPCTVGDVIGCGVNFSEHSAFYTKNGKVIGKKIPYRHAMAKVFNVSRH